jgi:DNA-directed RNA polymerase subunit beta'
VESKDGTEERKYLIS